MNLLWIFIVFSFFALYLEAGGRKKRCRAAFNKMAKPKNAKVEACCRYKRITVACNRGYRLVGGNGSLKCKKGKIRGKIPKCVAECGASGYGSKGRIVGGEKSKKGEWPWMAAIFKDKKFLCGGSLISRKHVLTAAHCFGAFRSPTPSQYQVYVGKTNVGSVGRAKRVSRVSRIFIHESFNSITMSNDIAIMKLSKPVRLNHNRGLICLPEKEDFAMLNKKGRDVFVMGWGVTEKQSFGQFSSTFSKVLNHLRLPLVDDKRCLQQKPYGTTYNKSVMLCAGDGKGEKDACYGDSGGPLAYYKMERGEGKNTTLKWHILGITSWGEGCAIPETYGYYARVFHFVDWIKKIVRTQE